MHGDTKARDELEQMQVEAGIDDFGQVGDDNSPDYEESRKRFEELKR